MSAIPPEVRNLRFDVEAVVPRHWHGGRASITNFFDNLSVFFPLGERFFIASVRAHEAFIVTDEQLRAEVRAFCGQEGIHGREHDRYNEVLRQCGYPIDDMEAQVKSLLAIASRLPPRFQLAITCALEHFTALMAHALLSDSGVLDNANPTMAALWRWHAAEENEHKAVAFDVFLAAGGTWLERIAALVLASLIFWAKVLEHQVRMMAVDGTVFSAREWLSLARFTFTKPGWVPKIAPLYLEYFRPSFHPNDIDATHLLEAWKRLYATSTEYRNAA